MAVLDSAKETVRNLFRAPFVWRALRRERGIDRSVRHRLAICAIFREEAPFLAEWIDFHRKVGVSHFYLYNNFSTDDKRTKSQPASRNASTRCGKRRVFSVSSPIWDSGTMR